MLFQKVFLLKVTTQEMRFSKLLKLYSIAQYYVNISIPCSAAIVLKNLDTFSFYLSQVITYKACTWPFFIVNSQCKVTGRQTTAVCTTGSTSP